MRYRTDIDGLRAVAVLPVVAFHAGVDALGGGFVGVDVFFVISGYLIGAGVLADVKAGTFTLAGFYERRLRRIYPALAAMLAGTALAAWLILLPPDLKAFGASLLAAVTSVSNLYFLADSGYFALGADLKPLLHTWSLAVEEQFYVFFPLLMMAAGRFLPGRYRLLILGLALVSFAVSAVTVFIATNATFYLPVTRAWELLLGSALAAGAAPKLTSAAWRNAAAAAGLALILAAVFAFGQATPFPGPAALVPCLGAALILAAGEAGPTLVGRLLSLRPLVFVGLISYSLYLWHWPVLVLWDLAGETAGPAVTAGLVALAFGLATLSWRFVERPFRVGARRPSRRGVFVFSLASTLAIAAAGGAMMATKGAPWRFTPEVARTASYLDYDPAVPYREDRCFISDSVRGAAFQPELCLKLDPARPNWLLVGDSHGAHLRPGLATLEGVNLLQANASGCDMVLEDPHRPMNRCRRLARSIYEDWLPAHRVDRLLLASRWSQWDIPAIARTLDWAKARGIDTVLFGPVVQYEDDLPRLLAKGLERGDPGLPYRHRRDEYAIMDARLAVLAREKGVRYVSLAGAMCDARGCETRTPQGVPLQFDYGHLTEDGSKWLVRRLQAEGALAP